VIQTTSDRTGVEGRLQARTDLDRIEVYTGSTWRPAIDYGTPASWTPTLTQSGRSRRRSRRPSTRARVARGRLVPHDSHRIRHGRQRSDDHTAGHVRTVERNVARVRVIYDASGTLYTATIQQITTTTVGYISDVAGPTTGGNPNVALAASDIVAGQLTYYR